MVYDTAIIGGGLAGLTTAIGLSQKNHSVILFEKEQYPFHKVCGEYISMESWNYLQILGLPLKDMNLPVINHLTLSSPSGNTMRARLSSGGFGISRYKIDKELKDIAVKNGVIVMENCKVEDIVFNNGLFTIHTGLDKYISRASCGSFGKRSNIDVKWKRNFIGHKANRLNNYVGVKYHIATKSEPGTIALHNFRAGYCGISEIEENKYCLCYLSTAKNLKKSGSIEKMEKEILSENPHLKKIFETCTKLYRQPLSISQISFDKKIQVENHVLMIGDAAGMITPLCGNGMSMAIHAGKIATGYLSDFLNKKITRDDMEKNYTMEWKKQFEKRIMAGRMIQRFFGSVWISNIFIATMKRLPWLAQKIIGLTHGKSF